MRRLVVGSFIVFLGLFVVAGRQAQAQEAICSSGDLGCYSTKIDEYKARLVQLQTQKNTLSNKIASYNNQIQLTALQIQQTEAQIAALTSQISDLESRLSHLSELFKNRTVEGYRLTVEMEPLAALLTSDSLSNFVTELEYLRTVRENDKRLMIQVEEVRSNYDGQRTLAQLLANRLQAQKESLDQAKREKEYLLQVTGNEEKKYQELLAKAMAEYEAIQAIIAGKGEEVLVGSVGDGQRIASIISGQSCNSTGSHLHFMVRDTQSGNTLNPFSFLKGGIDYVNCSGSSCGAADGDPFNPSGSWGWPISSPIKFSQGYGGTWATRNDPIIKGLYSFHNGIDISTDGSSEVRAVKAGTLYRGAFNVGSCQLRYVRLRHSDSSLETYYLHVDY